MDCETTASSEFRKSICRIYALNGYHYVKEVGDFVLNRLFDYQQERVPDDFGVLITPDNIESYLAQVRTQRETWADQNPGGIVQLVQGWSQQP